MEECSKTTPQDRGRQTVGCSSGQTSRKEDSSSIQPETTRCDVCNKDCHSHINFSAISDAATTQPESNKIKKNRMYHPWITLTDGGLAYDEWPPNRMCLLLQADCKVCRLFSLFHTITKTLTLKLTLKFMLALPGSINCITCWTAIGNVHDRCQHYRFWVENHAFRAPSRIPAFQLKLHVWNMHLHGRLRPGLRYPGLS